MGVCDGFELSWNKARNDACTFGEAKEEKKQNKQTEC